MSGPIVRKYGFPNHEQIFGRRPPEHGVEAPKKDEAAKIDAGGSAKDEKPTTPKSEPHRD